MNYGRTYDFTRYDDYVAYFKALAEDHPAFFHGGDRKTFFQWKMEDLDKNLNSLQLKFPAMIIEEPEDTFSDNGAGYVTDKVIGAIVVINQVRNFGDTAEETQVKTECKKLAVGILARLYHDKYKMKITGFDPNDCKGGYLGPVWDNCFGYRLEISLQENSTDALLNPADYTETLVDNILEYAQNNGFAVSSAQAIFDTIYNLRRIA